MLFICPHCKLLLEVEKKKLIVVYLDMEFIKKI